MVRLVTLEFHCWLLVTAAVVQTPMFTITAVLVYARPLRARSYSVRTTSYEVAVSVYVADSKQ